MGTASSHWDAVYRSRQADEVSWFQAEARTSLELITAHATQDDALVDVGAGASVLVDSLLGAGWRSVTLLDVSGEGLAKTRRRLGDAAERVAFVVTDLLAWTPDRTYRVWHDRAVFHFLVEPDDRAAYVATATRAVAPGGVVVLGTFALDGPEQCSGLPTARYDGPSLAAQFAAAFTCEETRREVHRTPWGADQAFTWVVLRRLPGDGGHPARG